jgi:hypothetical protein
MVIVNVTISVKIHYKQANLQIINKKDFLKIPF